MFFLYTSIGLSYALRGDLKPVIAAMLMPAASISIVGISTLAALLLAQRRGL